MFRAVFRYGATDSYYYRKIAGGRPIVKTSLLECLGPFFDMVEKWVCFFCSG